MLQVSAGIIISNSKILCVQKGLSNYDYLSYKYEFPGGKIENNETPKDALIRELKEEIGADLSSAKINLFNELEYTYPNFSVHLYNFIIEVNNFDFQLKEHISSKWIMAKELSQLDWVAADKQTVEKLKVHFNE